MNGEGHSGSTRDSGRHGSSRDVYRDERRDRDRDRDRGHRRRSRSPGHRSRRDYEVDTYSSSRDYREREREERYSGRERHEERGWDRDRGDRRRERRDDDRRRGSDRDFERRRGGGHGREERRKTATPPPRKKEPTPDLADIVSVLERKRRLTQWDIKPPGYENVTAEQAKISGMFPLPGAPRQQVMDPSRLQAFMAQPGASADSTALKPGQSRQSKRLFIYSLPAAATDESLVEFFNLQLNGLNVIVGTDPCLSGMISKDRKYGMVEFRRPEDATVALALDGITMEADAMDASNGTSNGSTKGLRIKRPQDYIAPTVTEEETPSELGGLSSDVKDSPNKICVSHIPIYLTDEQVIELLSTFGQLKAFVLVKDIGTEQSRGIAFCEYTDPAITDVAVEGLNNMQLGDEHIVVQRASVGIQQVSGLEMGVNAMSMLAGTQSADLHESRVLQLLNMITAEELMDNDEYEEICEDVREECEKFGRVLELKIPRPSGTRQNPGVGKVFVKFEAQEGARAALQALAGRKFADRTVVTTYFGEEYFDVNAW